MAIGSVNLSSIAALYGRVSVAVTCRAVAAMEPHYWLAFTWSEIDCVSAPQTHTLTTTVLSGFDICTAARRLAEVDVKFGLS